MLVLLVPLCLFLVPALWVARSVPFPAPIDEAQHLAFIIEMEQRPALFPDHSGMAVPQSVSGEAGKANYLNHPSPYYHAMAAALDHQAPVPATVPRLRLLNMAVAAAGVLLLVIAGAVLLPSFASRMTFGVVLVMFPKLALISGLINNDSLGLVATGVTMLGMALFASKRTTGAAVLCGAGLALAGWTKLTVLVMLGCASFIVLLLLWASGRAPGWRQPAALAGTAAVGILPTIASLGTTGRVLWASSTHNAVPTALRPDLSIWEHHQVFAREMVLKWPALEPAAAVHLVGLAVLTATCLWFVPKALRGIVADPAPLPGPIVAVGMLVAIPLSMAIHATYGWGAFQRIGDLTSAQPRYYYALWPGVALMLALLLERWPAARNASGRVKVLVSAVGAALLVPSSSWLLVVAG